MKITSKTTKEQLKQFLGANAKAVQGKDKDLFDQMAYADQMDKKDPSKVKRQDLVDLAKSVIKLLGDTVTEATTAGSVLQPVAEASVKKLTKGVSKKQEVGKNEKNSTPVKEEKAPAKEAKVTPKKPTAQANKTSEAPAKEEKAPKQESKPAAQKPAPAKKTGNIQPKTVDLAGAFPKTLDTEDGHFELAEDIKTMEDLHTALGNDEEIVFAYYWTKRHLKQFPYFGDWVGHPTEFKDDLDLCTTIYVSDEHKVSYQISMYTEAIYTILPSDFEVVEGVRTAGGIEYQIYRKVEEAGEEQTAEEGGEE